MTVAECINEFSAHTGITEEREFVFGIDLSESQSLSYDNYTAVRDNIYSITADISQRTARRDFVDGDRTAVISDMLKIHIDFASAYNDNVQRKIISACRNGKKLRCVYIDLGNDTTITADMTVTDIKTEKSEIIGMIIHTSLCV